MSDPVTRLNAALEGRYRIESELGEGGMATVYLADDLKHERKVALKVLKPELAAVVGAERFLAEIKTTANLTHPNILPLFDSGEADTFLYYVMPFIEGESLRDRLDREHQLPVDEAVKITTDLAEALDYAHRHKVIHRDIKPANIMLHEGRPLIADFGIALAVGTAGGGRLTETGLSLGTPFYMSPEQATGDQFVGASTDTYALGSVLYEMLTGDPPYMGSTAQAVLGQIISSKAISATEKRASIPANVDSALRKALEKLPADRFKSSQDFAKALGDEHFRYGEVAAGVSGNAVGMWNRLSIAMTTSTLVLAGALGWSLLRPEPPDPPAPVIRVSVLMEEDQSFHPGRGELDLSTDGSLMVYRGLGDEGQAQLWLRRWDALEATPIRNTDGAHLPAISPDGREVAFGVGIPGSIRVVPLQGGVLRTLTYSAQCCPSWSPGGDWVYYTNPSLGLSRVPASGGPSEVVTQVDTAAGDIFHASVDALPGGRGVLFVARERGFTNQRIQSLDLETGEIKDLTPGETPRYSPTGHLLFMDANEGTLLAAPFDLENLELTGAAVPVTQGVLHNTQGWPFWDISESGTLVYVSDPEQGDATQVFSLGWVNLDGSVETLPMSPTDHADGSISPDGSKIAYIRNSRVWIYDVLSGRDRALREDDEGADEHDPVWSPDGIHVLFLSLRESTAATHDLYVQRVDGSDPARHVGGTPGFDVPWEWREDGAVLFEARLGDNQDIYTLNVDEPGSETPLLEGDYNEVGAVLSPDGRWMAYHSNESGEQHLYVRSYPDMGNKLQVSERPTGLLRGAIWSPDGRSVAYVDNAPSEDRSVLSAVLDFSGGEVSVVSYVELFSPSSLENLTGAFGVLDRDPVRLLHFGPVGDLTNRKLIMILNFFEELKRRVPN